MGAAEPVELDAVLERAQEPVCRGERLRVLPPDVAALGQGGQRGEGGAGAQRAVGAPVDELEELDAELDVAQAPGSELELPVGLAGRDVVLDAAPHRLDVLDEVVAGGGTPHERGHGVDVGPTQRAVPRDRTRLEQGLELPGLGPALVVGDVRVEGADQRAVLALGPQRGVDLPERARGRRARADPDEPGREVGPDRERRVLVGAPSAGSATKMTSTSLR